MDQASLRNVADMICMNPTWGRARSCQPHLLTRESIWIGFVTGSEHKRYILFEGPDQQSNYLGRFLVCEACFAATPELAFIYLTSLPSGAL